MIIFGNTIDYNSLFLVYFNIYIYEFNKGLYNRTLDVKYKL